MKQSLLYLGKRVDFKYILTFFSLSPLSLLLFHFVFDQPTYPHVEMQCVTHQIPSDSPFLASAFYLFTIGCIYSLSSPSASVYASPSHFPSPPSNNNNERNKRKGKRKKRNAFDCTIVLIMMVAVIPMGLLNLDDNIYIQVSMFRLLFLLLSPFSLSSSSFSPHSLLLSSSFLLLQVDMD